MRCCGHEARKPNFYALALSSRICPMAALLLHSLVGDLCAGMDKEAAMTAYVEEFGAQKAKYS